MAEGQDVPTQHANPPVPGAAHRAPAAPGFDDFYRGQYQPLVQFVHQRRKTEDDPEDLAQESLVRFMRYVGRYPAEVWRPLLYRIAGNLVKERWRRSRARRAIWHIPLEDLQQAGQEPASGEPNPEEVMLQVQWQAKLSAAVSALPNRARQVYLLRFVRGMSTRQIALHCDISERMVEKHLSNSMLHIRRAFTRTGGDA